MEANVTRVIRPDHAPVSGALVVDVDGEFVELEYDEGGSGWWPIAELTVEPPSP